MPTRRIRALLEQNGKTAVGFAVPEAVVLALGKGRRPPVRVTLKVLGPGGRPSVWTSTASA